MDSHLTSSAACLVQWQWSVCDEGSLKCIFSSVVVLCHGGKFSYSTIFDSNIYDLPLWRCTNRSRSSSRPIFRVCVDLM